MGQKKKARSLVFSKNKLGERSLFLDTGRLDSGWALRERQGEKSSLIMYDNLFNEYMRNSDGVVSRAVLFPSHFINFTNNV